MTLDEMIVPTAMSDPAAYRSQPARDGPDFWPTIDRHLIRALVHVVLPMLPPAAIWEMAAGAGHLVDPLRQAGREVHASDLCPGRADILQHDFLRAAVPPATMGNIAMTNPPGNQLDPFIARGLQLLDGGEILGLVLLLRLDHLQGSERVDILNRATWEVHCNWRPLWIPGTTGNGRWSYHWICWLNEPRRAPLYLRDGDLDQWKLPLA